MHDDFAVEPVPGLPELPPEGERVLWQGRPRWWSLSKRQFLVPLIALYFLGLSIWALVAAIQNGEPVGAVVAATLWPLVGGSVVIGLLMLMALWIAKTTIYTITSERVVFRFGLALQMTVNYPFRVIKEAQVRVFRDGTGNIPLRLMEGQRASSIIMWPHTRPFYWFRPQPMLRAIPVPEAVAKTLGEALGAHAERLAAEGRAPNEPASSAGDPDATSPEEARRAPAQP